MGERAQFYDPVSLQRKVKLVLILVHVEHLAILRKEIRHVIVILALFKGAISSFLMFLRMILG